MITPTEKRPYEAPQLTVVTFKTERGYAASGLFALGRHDGEEEDVYGMQDYEVQTEQSWF